MKPPRRSAMFWRGIALVALTALAFTGINVTQASAAQEPGWLHTQGNRIVTATGDTHIIRAISWFGMETSNCAPHGLWTISLEEGLQTIAEQGFNTIRLPYANQCLSSPVSGIDYNKNPELQGLSSLQVMDHFISRADAYGLSIILDRHRPDYGSQSELWYTGAYSEERWISDWVLLAKRYSSQENVIGADLHNEPHGGACWACGDPKRDWKAAAERAGNAVLAANPHWLILVEGVEKSNDGTNYWWGGNLRDAGQNPIELAVPNRVVYSPHDYPSTVYNQPWFSSAQYPNNLEELWHDTWGYLAQEKNLPVLLGEFGTNYQSESDKLWLDKLVSYLQENSISFSYWSFNPNSGDTGGIVRNDWTTLESEKLDALRPLLGETKPVIAREPEPIETQEPTPLPSPQTPQENETPSETMPSPAPSSEPSNPTPEANVPAQPTPAPTTPVAPAPERSTPEPAPSPSVEPNISIATTASYIRQSAWGEGYVVDLIIRGSKGTPLNWSVSWSDAQANSVVNAWGATCSVSAGTVTCIGSGYGKDNFQWSDEVRVGAQISSSNGNLSPQAPTLSVK